MDAKLGAASLFDFEVSEKFVNDVLSLANLACQQSRYLPQVLHCFSSKIVFSKFFLSSAIDVWSSPRFHRTRGID